MPQSRGALQRLESKKSGVDFCLNMDQFLVGYYKDRARSTIHFAQSSLKFALLLQTPGCDPRAKLPEFMALRATFKSGDYRIRNSSSKKIKWCAPGMLEDLIFAIQSGKCNPNYKDVAVLLVDGISLLGARPCEFLDGAEFNWQHPATSATVTFKNAKAGNSRAHGPTRTLVLTGYALSDLSRLNDLFLQLPECIKSAGGPGKLLTKIQSIVRAANSKISGIPVGRSLTLYSLRHQFAADLRRAGVALPELAALMGHATDRTATQHYARPIWGQVRKVLPRAKEEEVSRVKKVFTAAAQRIQILFQKKAVDASPAVTKAAAADPPAQKPPLKKPPSPKDNFGMGM